MSKLVKKKNGAQWKSRRATSIAKRCVDENLATGRPTALNERMHRTVTFLRRS